MKSEIKNLLFIIGVVLIVIGIGFFFFTNTGLGMIGNYFDRKKGDSPVPFKNEIVMPPNATITATTNSGTISISSGKGLKRYYTWDNVTRSAVLGARSTRWYGSLGIYNAGMGSHWLPKHNGISRGVLEEGQQHFDTYEEAMSWLKMKCRGCVYNDSGLVVWFSKSLSREQLNVDVWQIYIGGETPSLYQEKAAESFGSSLDENEINQIYGGRKSKIYNTGGNKPTKLEGSNNNAITSSWDKLKAITK